MGAVIDQAGVEVAVKALLRALGEDPQREGLLETPARVARSYRELLSGYDVDPAKVLDKRFDAAGYDQMVAVSGIDFHSMCEHHMLPFSGSVVIGYIPDLNGKVVGLSKLARLVEVFARRLQIQERMTMEIADALADAISPQGIGVIVRAQHLCMCARGVGKQNAFMTTSMLKGLIKDDAKARSEFMQFAHS